MVDQPGKHELPVEEDRLARDQEQASDRTCNRTVAQVVNRTRIERRADANSTDDTATM